MKKIISIVSVCAVVATMVVILVMNRKSTKEKTQFVADISSAVAVKVVEVKESTYTVGFSSNGVLQALRELPFVSDISGRVVNICVDEGSAVSKGKVLIELDNEMLRVDVSSAKTTFEGVKKDYERFKNANAQGGVTDQQLDNLYTQMMIAESRYIISKRHLADASIKSPIAGTINKRYVEVGSYLNPGTKLFDIIDDSQLKAICFVTEKQIITIKKGQAVTLVSETFPDELFTGKITFIGEKADRSLNFPVEITLINKKRELKSGMFVSLYFNSDTQKNGVIIPRNAISGSVQAANVFVVENGIVKKKPVIAGSMVGEQIEVLRGLQSGDSLIIGGLINITEGSKVKYVQ